MEILINKETDNLMKDQNAFWLLLQIAYNTKTDEFFSIPECEPGEAFFKVEEIGMNLSTFRTAKAKLIKWGFASFRTSNRGVIAKLTTDKFFKI